MTAPNVSYRDCCPECQSKALHRKERALAARGVASIIEYGAKAAAEQSPMVVVNAAREMQKALLDIAELNMGITA